MPQPAYPGKDFIRLNNPSTFRINDITIGSVNADVIKELTLSTVTKDVKTAKVDLAWRSILEQRTYYPVYPANPSTPIEWSQFKHMMFPDDIIPDLLLIPSDLMLLAKVSTAVCSYRVRISRDVSVSIQECSSKGKRLVLMLISLLTRSRRRKVARIKVTKPLRESELIS